MCYYADSRNTELINPLPLPTAPTSCLDAERRTPKQPRRSPTRNGMTGAWLSRGDTHRKASTCTCLATGALDAASLMWTSMWITGQLSANK